jgi:hypothetical protein
MSNKKQMTQEIINERLEALGFGEKQAEDQELIIDSVLKHFHIEFTDKYDTNIDFHIYPEQTYDGYEVYVATAYPNIVNISENIHYNVWSLEEALRDFIAYSNGTEDYPSRIFVYHLGAYYIDCAIEQLFEELADKFEAIVVENLLADGYEHFKYK